MRRTLLHFFHSFLLLTAAVASCSKGTALRSGGTSTSKTESDPVADDPSSSSAPVAVTGTNLVSYDTIHVISARQTTSSGSIVENTIKKKVNNVVSTPDGFDDITVSWDKPIDSDTQQAIAGDCVVSSDLLQQTCTVTNGAKLLTALNVSTTTSTKTKVVANATPSIVSVSASGTSTITLTINGLAFDAESTVKVGDASCGSVSFASATQLTCTISSLAVGTYNVQVTVAGGSLAYYQGIYTSTDPCTANDGSGFATSSTGKRRIFATSVSYTGAISYSDSCGSFTGIAAADLICKNLADSSSNTGNHGGKWTAVITSSAQNLYSSSGTNFRVYSAGAWTGIVNWSQSSGYIAIANDTDSLFGAGMTLANRISFDENGTASVLTGGVAIMIWTGANTDGTPATGAMCSNWTTAAGGSIGLESNGYGLNSPQWFASNTNTCNTQNRLICIEK